MTRPTQAIVLLLVLLVAALAGVPGVLRSSAPDGSMHGVVVDGRGYGVEDAAVFLFSEALLQLFEETRTDAEGSFAFQLSPARARVFVRPQPSSGLLSAWGPASEESSGKQAFVLHPARPISVFVLDEGGLPLQGAEVRVYERRGDSTVLALAETDARGHADLLAPAEADLAAFAPGTHLARWRLAARIPEGGTSFSFHLPPAHALEGRVQDENGPVAGILAVASEEGGEGAWSGFARSDEQGRFVLSIASAGAGATLVRTLDPALKHLPARARVNAERTEPLELTLDRGAPLVVRTTRSGLPLISRVWTWSPEAEAWSFGARTNGMGRVTLPVSARFAIHAEPLDPSYAPLEAWDVPFESGTLQLEAEPDS